MALRSIALLFAGVAISCLDSTLAFAQQVETTVEQAAVEQTVVEQATVEQQSAIAEIFSGLKSLHMDAGEMAVLLIFGSVLILAIGWAVSKVIRTARGESTGVVHLDDQMHALEQRIVMLEQAAASPRPVEAHVAVK